MKWSILNTLFPRWDTHVIDTSREATPNIEGEAFGIITECREIELIVG